MSSVRYSTLVTLSIFLMFSTSYPSAFAADPSNSTLYSQQQPSEETRSERKELREEMQNIRTEHDALRAEHDQLQNECSKGQNVDLCKSKFETLNQKKLTLHNRVTALHQKIREENLRQKQNGSALTHESYGTPNH